MRLRVVCGLAETMATFSPVRAFSSVLFPALGRPRYSDKSRFHEGTILLRVCLKTALASARFRVRPPSLRKYSFPDNALKGHDFSRAKDTQKSTRALAPEACFLAHVPKKSFFRNLLSRSASC